MTKFKKLLAITACLGLAILGFCYWEYTAFFHREGEIPFPVLLMIGMANYALCHVILGFCMLTKELIARHKRK